MKERSHISQLKEKVGQKVVIAGFIQAVRDQGGIIFLIIRDITGTIQCVVLKGNKEAFDITKETPLESVVKITGKAKEEKQAPGGYEVEAETMEVLSRAGSELPIPVVSEKGGEETEITKRLDWRYLDLRKPSNTLIFKVWTSLEKGFREYFDKAGYIQFYSPSFMNAPSESGADVFEVKYFDRKAYLAQSPQFYKQMAMASGFEKAFSAGPVFRAEQSFTTRHMTEFTGWDFEISYIDSHMDVMAEEENMIVSGFERIKKDFPGLDITVPKTPFPKLTMKEAKEKLAKADIKSEKAGDLTPEEEREINKIVKNETGHEFLFVYDWPQEDRAFYHMRYGKNNEFSKSADLIYEGVEITTLAQREHRYDVLIKQADERGMSLETLKDYLSFFKYGCPPHGGAGIGPGRIIMGILGLNSVKEATFVPRDVKRVTP